MAADKLTAALTSVDWNANVAAFIDQAHLVERIAASGFRLALWANQFESADNGQNGNPALCFIREMQIAGHLVATTSALACYKTTAASLRTIVETALYYTYFRVHPVELGTLVRNSKWFISKDDVIEYHRLHTDGFAENQQRLQFVAQLNPWYSRMSAIIHGQLPGQWVTQVSIADTKPDLPTLEKIADEFEQCVRIVDALFLCTAGKELWDYFSHAAREILIKGMPGDLKAALKLG